MQQLWNVTLKEYNVGEFLSILQLSNIRKTSTALEQGHIHSLHSLQLLFTCNCIPHPHDLCYCTSRKCGGLEDRAFLQSVCTVVLAHWDTDWCCRL
jgi:hypothetical protein